MSKKHTLDEFCSRWNGKILEYNEHNLSEYFDKFFSLFVIFNRLYVEVAKILVKENPEIYPKFSISKRIKKAISEQRVILRPILPDENWCATDGIDLYCKRTGLKELIFDGCNNDLETIKSIIRNRELYFFEDYLTNTPLWDKDFELCKRIDKQETMAVLELIYIVRCNLFHGEKEFSQAQHSLLQSINVVLSRINQHIFDTLMSDDRF